MKSTIRRLWSDARFLWALIAVVAVIFALWPWLVLKLALGTFFGVVFVGLVDLLIEETGSV